jgi:hypothetical protein
MAFYYPTHLILGELGKPLRAENALLMVNYVFSSSTFVP